MRELKYRAIIEGKTHYFTLADLALCHETETKGSQMRCEKGILFEDQFGGTEWECGNCGLLDIMPWLAEGNRPHEYTGLKDSHGVEIYEGDVLGTDYRVFSCIEPLIYVVWSQELGRWSSEQIVYGCGELEEWLYEGWLLENITVIGNIYQNSELLESEA